MLLHLNSLTSWMPLPPKEIKTLHGFGRFTIIMNWTLRYQIPLVAVNLMVDVSGYLASSLNKWGVSRSLLTLERKL